jgi:hypothetical protein
VRLLKKRFIVQLNWLGALVSLSNVHILYDRLLEKKLSEHTGMRLILAGWTKKRIGSSLFLPFAAGWPILLFLVRNFSYQKNNKMIKMTVIFCRAWSKFNLASSAGALPQNS